MAFPRFTLGKHNTKYKFTPDIVKAVAKSINTGASPRMIAGILTQAADAPGDFPEQVLVQQLEEAVYQPDFDHIHDTYMLKHSCQREIKTARYGNRTPVEHVIDGVTFGDMAGSTLEFTDFDPEFLPEDIAELAHAQGNRPTDDTAATLATAKCLKEQEAELHQLYEKWISSSGFALQPHDNPFIKYYKECVRSNPDAGWSWHFMDWALADGAEPYRSYGDGAAMRVAPIGAMYDDPDQVVFTAAVSATSSHNHPEGIKGAVVTAMCAWLAMRCSDKEMIREYMVEHYKKNEYGFHKFSLSEIKQDIPKDKHDASCMFAVPAAIICFLEAGSYKETIRNACAYYGDTDTIAAIAGGIAAAYYGYPGELGECRGKTHNCSE